MCSETITLVLSVFSCRWTNGHCVNQRCCHDSLNDGENSGALDGGLSQKRELPFLRDQEIQSLLFAQGEQKLQKMLTSVKRRLLATVGETVPWSPSLVQLKSVALAQVCSWPRHLPGSICQEQ